MNELFEELGEKFRDFLDEGGSLVVRCEDDEIIVESEEPSLIYKLREDQTELYGYLASVSERIGTANGCALRFGLLLLAVGACVGLQTLVPGVRDSSWWIFPLCFIGALFLWFQISSWRETVAYYQMKPELEARLAEAGISRYRLVGILHDELHFGRLAYQMKCDQDASRLVP